MNATDRKALTAYVRWIADAIGLRDWEFRINTEGTVPDAMADVEALDGRRSAKINFAADFRDKDAETQRMVVVHELVHCHLTPLQNQVESDLVGVLGRQSDEVFSASFRRNLEYGVDAITQALASHLPLIDWPE